MTDAIQLLRSSSLPMLVQEELERLIMTGELPPGTRINESDIAARFGTSRGPIREALRALEEAGLARNEKNRGVFVREISVEEADEIYELREALEEIIGKRVAQRVNAALADDLNQLVGAMEEAANNKEAATYASLNLRFHELLLDRAGSSKLAETYRRLVKELHLFRMQALTQGGGLDVSADEHRTIVDAIVSGDARRAGAALRAHVAASRVRMLKAHRKVHPGSNKEP
ncbi:phosphonate utilization associated transcriptional regulator [Cupriavidus sp. H39]|uniref:phosphonate utilization associated transcriptional regulator n=1 Tax=Cupriavidus sp. H39 TaxID=3401635 RepID=UPI003D0538A4